MWNASSFRISIEKPLYRIWPFSRPPIIYGGSWIRKKHSHAHFPVTISNLRIKPLHTTPILLTTPPGAHTRPLYAILILLTTPRDVQTRLLQGMPFLLFTPPAAHTVCYYLHVKCQFSVYITVYTLYNYTESPVYCLLYYIHTPRVLHGMSILSSTSTNAYWIITWKAHSSVFSIASTQLAHFMQCPCFCLHHQM